MEELACLAHPAIGTAFPSKFFIAFDSTCTLQSNRTAKEIDIEAFSTISITIMKIYSLLSFYGQLCDNNLDESKVKLFTYYQGSWWAGICGNVVDLPLTRRPRLEVCSDLFYLAPDNDCCHDG